MPDGPRGGHTRQQWCRPRRVKRSSSNEAEGDLQAFFEEALTLQRAESTFNMDLSLGREQLARRMWDSGDPLGETSTTAANRELAALLEVLMRNSYRKNLSSEAQSLRT